MAGPGGGHGSDEDVERFWKPKEHSTSAFSNGTGTGVREPGSCPPPTPGPTSFSWPHLSDDSCTG